MAIRRLRLLTVIAAWLAAAACSRSPVHPSGTASDLTGTWNGPALDSSGPGQMTWQISQSGTSFSGTLTMIDAASGLGGRGSISGTMSASTIRFSIDIAAGGFEYPYDTCSAAISGGGEASSSSLTATYSGSNSCSGSVTSGQLTLTSQ
jgi:hypothetical protein